MFEEHFWAMFTEVFEFVNADVELYTYMDMFIVIEFKQLSLFLEY